jgi:hypothetical protein
MTDAHLRRLAEIQQQIRELEKEQMEIDAAICRAECERKGFTPGRVVETRRYRGMGMSPDVTRYIVTGVNAAGNVTLIELGRFTGIHHEGIHLTRADDPLAQEVDKLMGLDRAEVE